MKSKKKFKCPYWKKCKLYNKKSFVCNLDEGYYGSGPAGCYREKLKWK